MKGNFAIKRGLRILLFVMLISFLVVNVSAGIYLSQLEPSYNIGDVLDLKVTIDSVQDAPLKIKLTCDGNSKDIFNGPAITEMKIPLNSFWIGNLMGSCYISAEYAGEIKQSNPEFKISKELNVILSIDSFFAKPGETITVSGTAKRINGQGSNGEVEVNMPFLALMQKVESIKSNNTNETSNESATQSISQPKIDSGVFSGKINNGEFLVSFKLPNNLAAGDYKINVNAYEKTSSGEKTNEGSATANLKVSQILTSVDFALNNQNFNPGSTLSFKPVLLDQTGSSIKDQVSIIVTDEKLNRVFEKIAQSEETVDYKIPTNIKSGYYSIRISASSLNLSKNFFINEKAIASFELRNNTLVIKNIGNIKYQKDIQIELNGKPFVKKVDLDLDESKEFKLTGTEGNYDVRISDGETELKQGGVYLTGRVVGVSDNKGGSILEKTNAFVWFFLVALLLGGVIVLFVSVRKKRSVAYPSDLDKKKFPRLDSIPQPRTDEKGDMKFKKSIVLPKKLISPTEAEPSMVSGGQKERATILALKIKNKIMKDSKIDLQNALDPIYEKKGATYEHADFIVAIFSPLVTHSLRNEIGASQIALKVASSIKERNQKFKDKIGFGIGINSGEIINEIKDNKLKFTALGNSVILAKRLAELSNEEVLITKEAYEKGISEIKADRKNVPGIEAYEVKKVVDYDKNRKFIDDFIKRNEKDKSGKSFNKFSIGSPISPANPIRNQNSQNNQNQAQKKPDSLSSNPFESLIRDSIDNSAAGNIKQDNKFLL